MTTDLERLAAWRAGDRKAGDELFGTHFASVFRFFRNKVGDAAAEDLTQGCFLACVDGRDRFRQDASFRTYLFSIARNHLFSHLRARGRRDRVIDFTTTSCADLAASPITLLDGRAEHELLLRALRAIPAEFQIAVELYYWEGLSTRELADVMEIPEGTVRSRLTRARAHLAKEMRRLAASAELAESTLEDFEHWAASLKDAISGSSGGAS